MDMTFSVLMKVFDLLQLIAITLISYTLVHTIYKGERKKLMIFCYLCYFVYFLLVSLPILTFSYLKAREQKLIYLENLMNMNMFFRTTNQKRVAGPL